MILAVDVEENHLQGGTNEEFSKLMLEIKNSGIPYIFSCTRKELGLALYGAKRKWKTKISTLAILNFEGYNLEKKEFLKAAQDLKEKFKSQSFGQKAPQ